MAEPLVVGLLGAESTGKTALARGLAEHLREHGLRATWVPELLREWCDREGRTPRRDEQAAIAQGQTARIAAAAAHHDVVLADTTALMTAVYSRHVFGDDSLDAQALEDHRACRLTLLTGLDLPWEADGLQRDGPEVREPVDAVLRSLLGAGGIGFSLVLGRGERRLQAALDAVQPHLPARVQATAPAPAAGGTARWRAWCERCGDAACEHRLLASTRRA